jgi:hypothetical protein
MPFIKTIATGALVTAGLGLAALGVGAGVADAAPITSTNIAQWGGWGPPPPGPGWGGPGRVGWAPPPPPFYGGGGYGGYGGGWAPPPPCATGPLGLVHVCA